MDKKNILKGKHIVLGITAGLAASKCPELARMLEALGAEVRAVMTPNSEKLVTSGQMQAVTHFPVEDNIFDRSTPGSIGHIALGKWADIILIAPATADFLARLASGMGDDLLTCVCLATPSQIAVAPSMHFQMYGAPATQENLLTLKKRNILIWGPEKGRLGSGDIGIGRMLEPGELVKNVENYFNSISELNPFHILITAGPTQEAIDPVRYISNRSSGKMGFALAAAARSKGAKVTLISGPVTLETPVGVKRIDVVTALEMHEAVHKIIETDNDVNVFISCAAVSDFRPEHVSTQKIKKSEGVETSSSSVPSQTSEVIADDIMTLRLVKNPDIVKSVASLTTRRPFVVGFAAETERVEEYARIKLEKKKLDLICANDVSKKELTFGSDENEITMIWNDGIKKIEKCSKSEVASQIIDHILTFSQKTKSKEG
ncbi:Bifunctional phosphopantothenoylcysteine decarboxylase/phosphopantothenate synthase [Monocercomonoides exilis]|uniref:Bifunctional phosphopantothenoylcysteine decarboxylase/phosphopantothenate synthase n=1 Tax=Monocercomonoides exilis TaxID=2049356 RepID=UPI003559A1FF|nr:Bifunctional phosphopantothenoylcysteine decarboxylase/phosphopantothenate synthase [Monocercomonoides exilis]|eukprot:MONOS_2409.1-p1 / transcript=MONOS_2409.1 / gene=MONOS_2409 / organism=Monocercomonoides_exilis_PA203 / gene_product=bifunctional phosphopantothenoylcysteine decarboxylase / transcript_product=bifunctional phosphopantothenoylcysteine decarboxylase / location=Mono_scaffold00049:138670-139965(+) / protein_length=431 / sequence_SO=supercontig / SO=protein_coding / is_pseudo=false